MAEIISVIKRRNSFKKIISFCLTIAAVFAVVFLVAAPKAEAANRTASVSGNWNNTATWGGSSVPIAGDNVTIGAGRTVTVTADAACSTINFTTANTGTVSSITINSGILLAVSGNVTIRRPAGGNTSNITVDGGTLNVGGILAIQGTSGGSRLATLNISTGTVTVTGDLTTSGVDSQVIFSGAGTLNAGGTFMSGTKGTFTPDGGTVNFNAAGAQSIAPFTYTFNNVTLSGSGAKTTTNATINGQLSLRGTATTAGTVATYGAASTLE
jgi:hypothetical protein